MRDKNDFNAVKVFSSTMAKDRAELGQRVTEWLKVHPGIEVVDVRVLQSSDDAFHCLTFTLFYFEAIS